ncbi:MAG: PEP-CTERM sorting domain-containing protein [Planctomycetes bacterium]|nr:PEP-CTERM sorting domain-containing protein [Planctomycetota bacterium]
MQALSSFGSSGWLQPSAFPGVTGTNNVIRSIAFNPVTGSLLYANGSSIIPVNASTGAIGTAITGTATTGGTVKLNTVAVTSDGVIYGSNLTTNSTTDPFKVYRWASQSSGTTVSYIGNAGLGGSRVGDDIAIFGADSGGSLAFGFSNSPVVTGNNSFSVVSTGAVGSASAVTYTGGTAGAFRLGITFADADTVLGTQGSATIRRVSFLGTSGTLDGSNTLNTTNERGILYFSAYGTPLLATIVTGSGSSMNTVRLYDATNLATTGTATYLTQLNLASTSSNANANANGSITFGTVNDTPTLYALNTNNGIQAIQLVPEPSTVAVAGICSLGLAAVMLRRRGRQA